MRLVLHRYAASHPCRAVQAALRIKGLEYERDDVVPGTRREEIESYYGTGNTTMPGMLIGDEAVHTSVRIMRRLDELFPTPTLYPADKLEEVRAAEEWGDGELQDLGRRIPWGVLRFRPQAVGTLAGGDELDAAGIDGMLETTFRAWRYHRISTVRLRSDLESLPALLDRVDELIASGVIGGDEPNAADLQIGSTVRLLCNVRDLGPMLDGRPAVEIARRWFPSWGGEVPAGAFPAAVMGATAAR